VVLGGGHFCERGTPVVEDTKEAHKIIHRLSDKAGVLDAETTTQSQRASHTLEYDLFVKFILPYAINFRAFLVQFWSSDPPKFEETKPKSIVRLARGHLAHNEPLPPPRTTVEP